MLQKYFIVPVAVMKIKRQWQLQGVVIEDMKWMVRRMRAGPEASEI